MLSTISTSYGLVHHLWNPKLWVNSSFTSKRFLETIYCKKGEFSDILNSITIAKGIINAKLVQQCICMILKSIEKFISC